MNPFQKFRFLSVLALGTFAHFNAFALEVGDDAPCVVLEQQLPNGDSFEGCIRDQLRPETQNFTIIDFSSIYCSTCEANLTTLSQLTLDVDSTTTIRKLTIDRSKKAVQGYLADKGSLITFPTAFDTDRDAKRAYGVVSTPTLFILNKQNQIIYKHTGLLSEEDVHEIKELVGVCDSSASHN